MLKSHQGPILILVGITALLGGYFFQTLIFQQSSTQPDVIGQKIPDFQMSDYLGVVHDSKAWQDKVLVLNFWATWCQPCQEEIPLFVKLQDKYEHIGLQFVGISSESADLIEQFTQTHDVNYPLLIGDNAAIRLAVQLGNTIGAIPYTVMTDRDGRIASVKYGKLSLDEAENMLNTLLQGSHL